MRVLHVIPSVAARYGGPSRAIFPMCQALQAAGCDVSICTTNADGEQRLPVQLGRTINYEGIETIFFPSRAGEFKYSHRLASWLDTHIDEFDLVHIHAVFNHPSLAAARSARKRGVPYIVRPLGTLDPWCMNQKALKKRVFWQLFGKNMLQGAAAVHYTAVAEQQAVEQSLNVDHGVVIPLGVDMKTSRGGPQPERFASQYVLFLSRLHPKKGLEVLFEAFASLLTDERFRKWKLLIAGDGERAYVESLKSLATNLGLENSVVFTGWLEAESKSAAIRGASLLALPSYQENFGICVMEALACGVPVLVSPHVSLADEIKSAGAGWVAPVSRDGLRAVLGQALLSRYERMSCARAAQALSRNYGWPIASTRLFALYQSLVA